MYGDQEQQPSFTQNTEWRDPAHLPSGDTITMLILQRGGTALWGQITKTSETSPEQHIIQ